MHEGVPCDTTGDNNSDKENEDEEAEDDERPSILRTYKNENTLKDQQSTGRKRAARLYPLDETKPCEWSGLKRAGGGNYPIIGCSGNTQRARHHGPDKNTLNNDEGNVHRICHQCHNRWHTLNDKDYVPGETINLHDRVTKATPEDFVQNILFWNGRKLVKAKD